MPATGALIGTPPSISDRVERADRAHRGGAVGRQHLGHDAQRVGQLLERRAPPAAAPARRGGRGRSRGAWGCPRGRSRRWRGAACCSGACSASWALSPRLSSSWSIFGMPRVRTLSTWVSPRWNRPVPWAVRSTPTSEETGRRSAGPRPSMRTPSSTMRLRMTAFWIERAASLISFSRPANSSPTARRGPWRWRRRWRRCARPCRRWCRPRRASAPTSASTLAVHVVPVVEHRRRTRAA